MKWTVINPVRKDGEIKEVVKFAWFPTVVDYGKHVDEIETEIYKIVWLEKYRARLKWSVYFDEYGRDPMGRWEIESTRSM